MSLTSSGPSGAPWTSWVSFLLGEQKPMTVRMLMMWGLSLTARADWTAARMAPRSFPSATVWTCQPRASKRFARSSVNATLVWP